MPRPTPVLLVALLAAAVCQAEPGALTLTDLRCEHRSDPLGIGETAPRLSWELQAQDPKAQDLRQSAYEIIVAPTPEALSARRGDIWDSGRIASDRTSEIPYAGPPLASRQACWWAVRVWDQNGRPSGWSAPAHWTMGLLRPEDWRASWIGLDAEPATDGSDLTPAERERLTAGIYAQADAPAGPPGPVSVLVRRGFTVPAGRTLSRATFVVTPDQWCAISLNGKNLGTVGRWELARPIDLTAGVTAGDNVLGLHLVQEDGYKPAALGEIDLVFTDGAVTRLPIDSTWHFAPSAAPGWDTPGGEDATWKPLTPLSERKTPWHTGVNAFHFFAPPACLRRTFLAARPVRRATLYATALGLFEVSLNGRRIGNDRFAPGWTDYSRRVEVQCYDLTKSIGLGDNVIDVMLADGWYAGIAAYTGRRHIYGGYPRFAAQLEIEYADGTRETIPTDASWQGAFGPIRYADLLQGCATDERLTPSGWRPVATGLRAVTPGAPLSPPPIVEPARLDPARVTGELPAQSVSEPRPGVYVVDFGQNLVGWVRLRARGRSGQKIVVRHGEMLNPDGTVYTSNLRGAAATDLYWLRGGGDETLEPHFTYHGFRYAEISGLDGRPPAQALTAIVAGSPLRRTGEFSCSNPLLNRLYANIVWGQRGNYFEAPTDCPQRDERLGWTGDTQFFIPTAALNYDVASFIERWLLTLTDDQGEDGTFPDVAPATTHVPRAITAWGDAAIVCTHELWRAYGDTRVVERHFEALSRYVGWLELSAQKDFLAVGGYEDWLNLGGGAAPEVIDTAYGAYLAGLMEEMAGAIGRTGDAARFAALHAKFTRGFQDNFLLPDGRIKNSGQTGFALAFALNLIPPALRAHAADQFVSDIAARHWHLATGFIGTPRLLPALHAAGRDDAAYRLLLQDTYPSWLFPVKLGATTMWERWDGWTPDRGFQTIDMNSFNHYAFGAVGEYLYRSVLGIDTDGPGYRHVLLHPIPGGGLTEASGAFAAPGGRIEAHWRIASGEFIFDVTLPPNLTATVRLPSGHTEEIGSGHRTFREPWGR